MMARLKLFIPLLIFVVLGGFLLRGLWLDPQALPSALVDKPLPVFALPALSDGAQVNNKMVSGEVALFNVWATWCAACRVEHPFLQDLADQGVLIYGINYKDDPQAARRWLKQLGNPYRLTIMDEAGTLGLDLGVYGAPETYLVDARGIVRYRHVGVVDKGIWIERLKPVHDQLLAEAAQ